MSAGKASAHLTALPVVAICDGCGELGWLRRIGGKCWLCGGWVGHQYDLPREVMQAIRGFGFGFYGGDS